MAIARKYGPCTPAELQDKSCENPGNCTNACANKCDGFTNCKKCCTAFKGENESYDECRSDCKDVYTEDGTALP